MKANYIKKHILLALLGCGSFLLLQQNSAASSEALPTGPTMDAIENADAPDVIFSNLEPTPGDRFNTFAPYLIIGKRGDPTEILEAVAFIPKTDAQVKVLSAAIGYTKGTKRINLGIYSNDDGVPGAPLPGGQVSTEGIPDIDQCCQMTTVTLPGEGVTVTAGTAYWLVASPDNVNAPDFEGGWRRSYRAAFAQGAPPLPWQNQPGTWPAAQIRGTKLTGSDHPDDAKTAAGSDVIIYKNLGAPPYRYFNTGVQLRGNAVFSGDEIWDALPFTLKTDVHATTLAAAIGWVSGTRLINLGVYSDKDGAPGKLLPGGQRSTSDIPDADECCKMTIVRLSGEGVALKAGTQYWLVASPDNVNAPDFSGQWQSSSLALMSEQEPEQFGTWQNDTGRLLAAEIRGTLP